jgi:hypothetical protein
MRILTTARRALALHRDERGITGVVVAVCLFAIFGAAVVTVDAGNLWQTRRNIIIGTDASALQEAQIASLSTSTPSGCTPAWSSTVTRNSGTLSSPLSCTLTVTRFTPAGVPLMGYVVVDAQERATTRFGGAVGVGDADAYSLSAARWGPPNGVIGLRPFGLCEGDVHYLEWLAYAGRGYPTDSVDPYNQLRGSGWDHPAIAGAGVVHRIEVDNGGGTCGNAPGNWAWLDYNSESNPTGAQREWWDDGYTPNVYVHTGPDCTLEQAQDGDTRDGCIPGNTGNRGNSFDDRLEELKISGHPVPIMIFSALTGTGQISIFQAVGFLSVIVRDYNVHGSTHWLDLEFVLHNWGGSCCNPDAPDNGTRVTMLCDVDHNPSGPPITHCI